MNIKVTKLTSIQDAWNAIDATMQAGFAAKANLNNIYKWEHSPSRTQIFWIEMIGITRGVSDHFVRHAAVGQQHFVKTSRADRDGEGHDKMSLSSPTNHRMLVNAQHLIDMAKVRLCNKALVDTSDVMQAIKDALYQVDPELVRYLVPKCVYRNGVCSEPRACGKYKVEMYDPDKIFERIKRS